MPSDLGSLIQLGHDLTAFKYYALATGTILFYDYLLTLADEVKYVWSGNKSLTFWLFVVNRYFPMTYQLWQLVVSYGPQSQLGTQVCNKTAWYSNLVYISCTLLAQVMLTLRIYAVTLKHIPIAIGFAVIATVQFTFGIYLFVLTVRGGAQPFPPIPLDAYHLCVFVPHRTHHLAYTTISLFYDILAFSLVIFLAKKSQMPGLGFPSLLEVIARDAIRYFLVIFTSHLVLEMTLIFGREAVQLITAPGIVVYLPVMVSRVMLSLRKAADHQGRNWSIAEPTAADRNIQSMKFFRPSGNGTGERQDDISVERDGVSLGRLEAVLLDRYPEG